ncbi:hypothetical protein [Rugamonas sp.]|uniref:hypothetical protein n=1 Tax=Rugamonas sp. TaxID=1926287 RepID=UPI0025ECEF7E|nr:hypothetical protein [Rugamonas sp.]
MKLLPALALAVLAAACLALVYLRQGITPDLFFNSDAIYLPAVYHDLFERGGHFGQWYFTPAPYFFPDWPLYFGLRWLTGSVYYALAAIMAVQALLLWALSALVLRRFTSPLNATAAAALATMAASLAAVNGVFPYTYLMLTSYHFGTFLALLATLALLLPALRSDAPPLTRGALAGLALLAALTVLSDRLYLMQCALPALGALALLRRRLAPANWRPLALALLAACVAGVLLYKWKLLVPNGVGLPWRLGWRQTGANLRDLGGIAAEVGRQSPGLLLACGLYYATLLTLLPGTLLDKGWRLADPVAGWLGLFSVGSAGGVVAVMAVSSVPPTVRYLIPVFVLPLVLGPALLYALRGQRRSAAAVRPPLRRVFRSAVALWLGAALLAWPLTRVVAQSGPLQHEYYPADLACADGVFAQYDLHNGYGGYWDAAWVAMNTHRQPVVAPSYIDLHEHQWITTRENFLPRYDFALVAVEGVDQNKPPEALIVAQNGAPAASVVCGALKVLVYPHGGLGPLLKH